MHLKPLEREGIIDLWDDSRIRAGALWRDEIAKALDGARVALLLISADFLASDFIAENELPPLLSAAARDGLRIVPIILSASRYDRTVELARFQAVNQPSRPLDSMERSEQEKLFARVANDVEDALSA